MESYSTLASRLKLAMDKAKINMTDLARAVGVTHASVSFWCSGTTAMIRGETLVKVAAALGVSPSWLATGQGDMQEGPKEDDADCVRVAVSGTEIAGGGCSRCQGTTGRA